MGCGIKRIIQLTEAIQYQKISIINNSIDITQSCMYSWSSDGVCWTSWATIQNYDLICKSIESDFYLRILLTGNFTDILLNGGKINCYNICLDSSIQFIQDFCKEPNLFQPYNNLDCALNLQQQLADSVVCMFGIPIYYFRVNPNDGATDYTFKEHYLHHIEDVKQLKLMIPDGQMPSSNPKLTELDFDWEVDWETEISKTQFARAFGDVAYPKTGDFIYIPLMKRMWEVNAAYDEKNEGLMWRSTTWKLALIKYTDSTNVDTGEFEGIIDNLIQTYDETFTEIERNEQERESGSYQVESPSYAATNLYNIFMSDSIRKYCNDDVVIIDKNYNHRSNIVSRQIYKFKNSNGCIVYQKPICGDSGTLMFILEINNIPTDNQSYKIINFGNIQIYVKYLSSEKKFELSFDKLKYNIDPFQSYMVICKWNRATFNTELCIYHYSHKNNIPIYQLKPEMYWFDYDEPVCELIGEYNNDFDIRSYQDCLIHGYPCSLTNIKYYNKYLSKTDSLKESIKYSTNHDNCIINDLARPINDGRGYVVK